MNALRPSPLDRALLVVLAAFAVLLLVSPLARLPFWTELPNEGWNAVHALHAFSRALYPAPGAFIVNNYPPLWPLVTGALHALTGDPILPARIVAFASFLTVGAAICVMLLRFRASVAAAVVGALTFLIVVAGLSDSYVGLAEPQMLAHAIVTSSVALLAGAHRRRTAAIAAVGIVVGIFVKPIVIALPLAATLWLAIHRRHLLATWIVTGACASLLALSACVAIYGTPFVVNLLFPRVVVLHRLGTNLALISKAAVPLVAFGWAASRRGALRHPAMSFAALAIGASVLEILLFGGALGVSINIAFDLVIAASLGAALAFDRIEGASWRAALIAAIALRVATGMPNPLRDVTPHGRAILHARQAAIADVVARIAPLQGPIACEPLAACAWAGQANIDDLWKLRFETTLDSLDKPAFMRAVRDGRFGAVVTFSNFKGPADDRNLPGLYDALSAWYEPPLKAGDAFLIYVRKPR